MWCVVHNSNGGCLGGSLVHVAANAIGTVSKWANNPLV
jgi:hypothetical protein